jgi:hypothetical protein
MTSSGLLDKSELAVSLLHGCLLQENATDSLARGLRCFRLERNGHDFADKQIKKEKR